MSGIAVVSRRKFLRALLFMAAAGSAGSGLRPGGDEADRADLLASKLGNFFQDRDGARAVGVEYLCRVPEEADARELSRLICADLPQRGQNLALADVLTIKELLQRQQQRDFETDRIVSVQGWILSETEARLCALAALV